MYSLFAYKRVSNFLYILAVPFIYKGSESVIVVIFSLVEVCLIRDSAFVVSRSVSVLDLDFRGVNSEPVQIDVNVRDVFASTDDLTRPTERTFLGDNVVAGGDWEGDIARPRLSNDL